MKNTNAKIPTSANTGNFLEGKIQEIVKKTYLPEKIVNIINDSNHSKLMKERLVTLIYLIRKNRKVTGTDFVILPKLYLVPIIGSNYHLVTKEAEKMGLIEIDHHYYFNKNGGKSKCKWYKIKDSAMSDVSTEITYRTEKRPLAFVEERTINVMEKMSFDDEAVMAVIDAYINEEKFMAKVKVDDEIPSYVEFAKVKIGLEGTSRYCSVEWARNYAKENNLSCFYRDKKIVITTKEEYKKAKKDEIRFKWEQAYQRMKTKNLDAKIGTNGRLFSNMTNIPSDIRKLATIKGKKFKSADLKNSQMTMIGKMIDKRIKEDKIKPNPNGDISAYLRFIDLASSGKIYEFLLENSDLSSRDEAKVGMFQALFSGFKRVGKAKKLLEELFPGLVAELDEQKRQNGDSAFLANEMQAMESGIFVARILHQLYIAGFDVYSCHDSIYFLESDEEAVMNVITSILDEELGNYSLLIN